MELSHIKYGLFSVDEWKNVIATVATKKIREFEITQGNRKKLKSDIENVLHQVIDEVQKIVKEKNDQKGFKGLVKNVFIDVFVDIDDIKSGIPSYADKIIEYLEKPENREEIKDFILEKFNAFADETVGNTDYSIYHSILTKYEQRNKKECIDFLNGQEEKLEKNQFIYLMLVLFTGLVFFALMIAGRLKSKYDVFFAILSALVLLVAGVALPMIDIEALIDNFSFNLAGEPVSFENQVVFFQSKSILDVVWLLIARGELALIIVSILIFSFSVLIPLLKIIGSFVVLMQNKLPQSKLMNFLVFKSSKWSMADVMVIAIFMAYIGFNGVINSQLSQVANPGTGLEVFTTNNSSLQTGFYLFTAYCIFGLLLSSSLKKRVELVVTS